MLGKCVLCTSAIENLFHVFVLFCFAQSCWKEIRLDGIIIYSTSLEVDCFHHFPGILVLFIIQVKCIRV